MSEQELIADSEDTGSWCSEQLVERYLTLMRHGQRT